MRLIDVDAMHRFVEEKVAEGKDGWASGVGYEWAWALTAVDMQPIIDAVPVVRCKDCKWWNKVGCAISIVDDTDKPKADDFCSFGERKDGEG